MGQEDIEKAEEDVARCGDSVRSKKALLKEGKGDKADVDAAIEELKKLKLHLASLVKASNGAASSKEEFRAAVSNVLERKLFYIPSFKIYGSVAGLFDYGPPGASVKSNITQIWRQHFIRKERMLEVECPAVTPEVVLKASGHVDKFDDMMVTDVVTGDCYRADHLLEHVLEAILDGSASKPASAEGLSGQEIKNLLARVDDFNIKELGEQLRCFEVKAPDTQNDLSEPFPFNLMFKTTIGPKGDNVGYLRPETAQGIFVNFKSLLYYRGDKLPFAAAQIGQSFRNEIAPRQGLLRVREFTQAEIEHFYNPDKKEHPKFSTVADVAPLLYSRALQMGEEKKPQPMSLKDALESKVMDNQTLAYYIGRTYLFLQKIGIDTSRLRFRQHLANEMAHYAADCWDAEIECSYGWIECVGLADRAAFDLKSHAAKSQKDMSAKELFDKPQQVEVIVIKPNKQALGKAFKQKAKEVQAALEGLCDEPAMQLKTDLESGSGQLAVGGGSVQLTSDMVSIEKQKKMQSTRSFIPSVVEPSFGIGRIMYCLFEHSYYVRESDDKRTVFRFNPLIAPIQATVFPLLSKPEMIANAERVSDLLEDAGISNLIDTTGTTVGKRYARTDEIGIPFGLTIDRQTEEDDTVTVRERDTTKQVRVPIKDVVKVLQRLSLMELSWQDLKKEGYSEIQTADPE